MAKDDRDRNRENVTLRHWMILISLAHKTGTGDSLGLEFRVSKKTIRRDIKILKRVGWEIKIVFINTKMEAVGKYGAKTIFYSLPIRVKRLILELLTNKDIDNEHDWEDDSEPICGHDVRRTGAFPGCKGCKKTIEDLKDEGFDLKLIPKWTPPKTPKIKVREPAQEV